MIGYCAFLPAILARVFHFGDLSVSFILLFFIFYLFFYFSLFFFAGTRSSWTTLLLAWSPCICLAFPPVFFFF